MLQSMGSQRLRHDLMTEQQHLYRSVRSQGPTDPGTVTMMLKDETNLITSVLTLWLWRKNIKCKTLSWE